VEELSIKFLLQPTVASSTENYGRIDFAQGKLSTHGVDPRNMSQTPINFPSTSPFHRTHQSIAKVSINHHTNSATQQ